MNIKDRYKQCLRVHRIYGIMFDRNIVSYWMPKEHVDSIYWMFDAEPDHLYIKMLRLNSGGKLRVLKSQFSFKNKLIVR